MKKENKKKKRLLIALFMLVISAIALTTATYAWFSANKVVTTSGIDVKVTAATGISISADALDFGKEIDMDKIIEFAKDTTFASTLQLPEELNPVSTSGIVGANTEYSFVRGELGENEEVVSYTDSTVNKTFKKDKDGAETNYTGGDYIAFDVYIKSSQDINLKLADTTQIAALNTDAGTGNLETGLRIGFLPLGVSTDTSIANQQSKGYYGAKQNTTAVDGLNAKGETATEEEIAANANHYVKYLYKDVESSAVPAYLELIDSSNAHYIQSTEYAGNVFAVKAGINKVRVYIWLEGNDVDCVDAISISNGLKVALGFEVA